MTSIKTSAQQGPAINTSSKTSKKEQKLSSTGASGTSISQFGGNKSSQQTAHTTSQTKGGNSISTGGNIWGNETANVRRAAEEAARLAAQRSHATSGSNRPGSTR